MKRPIVLASLGTAGLILAAITVVHSLTRPHGLAYAYAVPPALDDGWSTGSLEQAGIDRRCIEAMTDWVSVPVVTCTPLNWVIG